MPPSGSKKSTTTATSTLTFVNVTGAENATERKKRTALVRSHAMKDFLNKNPGARTTTTKKASSHAPQTWRMLRPKSDSPVAPVEEEQSQPDFKGMPSDEDVLRAIVLRAGVKGGNIANIDPSKWDPFDSMPVQYHPALDRVAWWSRGFVSMTPYTGMPSWGRVSGHVWKSSLDEDDPVSLLARFTFLSMMRDQAVRSESIVSKDSLWLRAETFRALRKQLQTGDGSMTVIYSLLMLVCMSLGNCFHFDTELEGRRQALAHLLAARALVAWNGGIMTYPLIFRRIYAWVEINAHPFLRITHPIRITTPLSAVLSDHPLPRDLLTAALSRQQRTLAALPPHYAFAAPTLLTLHLVALVWEPRYTHHSHDPGLSSTFFATLYHITRSALPPGHSLAHEPAAHHPLPIRVFHLAARMFIQSTSRIMWHVDAPFEHFDDFFDRIPVRAVARRVAGLRAEDLPLWIWITHVVDACVPRHRRDAWAGVRSRLYERAEVDEGMVARGLRCFPMSETLGVTIYGGVNEAVVREGEGMERGGLGDGTVRSASQEFQGRVDVSVGQMASAEPA